MRKIVFILVFLAVLALSGPVSAEEEPGNGSVPPYQVWLPVLGSPVVCEDPEVADRWYLQYRLCLQATCWEWHTLNLEYRNMPESMEQKVVGTARIREKDSQEEYYYDIIIDYLLPEHTDSVGVRGIHVISGQSYEWDARVICADNSWSDWLGWEVFIAQ